MGKIIDTAKEHFQFTIGHTKESAKLLMKRANFLDYDIADDDSVICTACNKEFRPVLEK